MAALPYMQLYVADYLADTAHLTTEEHGAYLLLLFSYWQTGKPLRIDRLSTIARVPNERWRSVAETLSEFFNVNETHWMHFRVEADLEAVNSKTSKASAAGKASAKARFLKKQLELNEKLTNVSTDVDAELQHSVNHIDTDTDTDTDTEEHTQRVREQNAPPPDDDSERPKFAMTDAWEPDPRTFTAVLTRNGLAGQTFHADQLLEFRSYWISRPSDLKTQAQWEHSLAQQLKRQHVKSQSGGLGHEASGRSARSRTRNAHDILTDPTW